MSVIEYYDNTLIHQDNHHLDISIQTSLNGFSFAIYESTGKSYRAFKSLPFQNILMIEDFIDKVKELLDNENLLKLGFQKARILHLTQKSTLIPTEYFSPDKLKSYFEFNHTLNELDEIHYNYIEKIGAYNIFTVPSYFSGLIFKYYKQIHFFHQGTSLIEFALNFFRSKERMILINLNPNFFDLLVCEENKLKLYNSFMYQNENDVIYFLLYIFKQFQLKPDEQSVYLCGEHMMDQNIVTELKNYIKEVRYLDTNNYFAKTPHLQKLNTSRYLNLFNLIRCE